MKLTSEQLFNATIKLLSGKLANMRTYDTVKDDVINDCIEIAIRTAALIPETKKTSHNTGNLFENFPWKDGGVRRCDMEKWLKEYSGYTSNRVTDMIIKQAILNGTVTKRLNTRRYYPVTPR